MPICASSSARISPAGICAGRSSRRRRKRPSGASVGTAFAAVARARSLPVRASSDAARESLRAAGLRTPDRFFDGFHADQVSLESLERILEGVPEGISELMCHPGRVDEQLEAGSTYVAEREWEIEVLCDPGIRRRVRALGIELVGFGAL